MKKLRLKESVKNVIGVSVFFAIIITSVVVLNARMEKMGHTKSADVVATQTAQINR